MFAVPLGPSGKPKVKVPPALTEGLGTTLTCTALGLCSGTPPNITWTWRNTAHITPNYTGFKTDDLIVDGVRHRSNLTFTPSSQHHGSEVTCQVTFKGNITAMKTVTLNVTCEYSIPYILCVSLKVCHYVYLFIL